MQEIRERPADAETDLLGRGGFQQFGYGGELQLSDHAAEHVRLQATDDIHNSLHPVSSSRYTLLASFQIRVVSYAFRTCVDRLAGFESEDLPLDLVELEGFVGFQKGCDDIRSGKNDR